MGEDFIKQLEPLRIAIKSLLTEDYSEVDKLDVATYEAVKKILADVGTEIEIKKS